MQDRFMSNEHEAGDVRPPELRLSLPRHSAADSVATAGGAMAFELVPFIGSALSTTFQAAVQAISQREMDAWLSRMAEVVDALARLVGIPVEAVVGDGQFYQSLVRGSRAAQETTEPTKLDQLESGVAHSGSWTNRPPILERTLMRLLVQFEPEQIEFLQLVRDPLAYARNHPELGDRFSLHDVYKQVLGTSGVSSFEIIGRQLNDLYMSGVMRAGFGPTFVPLRENKGEFALTDLGAQLVEYCSPVRTSP